MIDLHEVSLHPPHIEVATLLSKNSEQKEIILYLVSGLAILAVVAVYWKIQHNKITNSSYRDKNA